MNKIVLNGVIPVVFLSLSIKLFNGNEAKITAINLISQVQFVIRENGKLFDRKDTVLICYFKDMVIYREKYFYIKYNSKAIKGDTIIASNDSSTIDLRETKFDYYIWKVNHAKGLKYRGNMDNISIIDVDSVKAEKMFKDAKFYDTAFDKLVERKHSADRTSFVEKYASFYKPDASYCDTTYYYFSDDLKNVPYSLSRTADNIKKTKLTGVRYIYGFVKNGIAKDIDMPRRELMFKIERTSSINFDEVKKIAEKFTNDAKKYNLD